MRTLPLAAAVLALTACGSSPAPAASPSASPPTGGGVVTPAAAFGDACRLLSAAEVRAAIGGGPVGTASQSDPQAGSICTYMRGSTLIKLQVTVEPAAADARAAVDQLGGSPLAGLGDDARVAGPAGLGTVVGLARGSTLAVLSTTSSALSQETVVSLARRVAGRL